MFVHPKFGIRNRKCSIRTKKGAPGGTPFLLGLMRAVSDDACG